MKKSYIIDLRKFRPSKDNLPTVTEVSMAVTTTVILGGICSATSVYDIVNYYL